MNKYLLFSFLFLSLLALPLSAKGSSTTSSQKATLSPTGNQVKNENQIQTKNQGEAQQLSVQTQESEQLNQKIDQNLTKVSDQVQELINTLGAKGGIGQQVKEIAQNQDKRQNEIKNDFENLNSRSALTRFFIGTDKKIVLSLQQKVADNESALQQLEQLKSKTKNRADLEQLQATIELMSEQNLTLKNKINLENKSKGMFGWLLGLFNQ